MSEQELTTGGDAAEAQPAKPSRNDRQAWYDRLQERVDKSLEQIHAGEGPRGKAGAVSKPQQGEQETSQEVLAQTPPASQSGGEHPGADSSTDPAAKAQAALDRIGLNSELLEGISQEQRIAAGKVVADRLAEQQREAQSLAEERNRLAAQVDGAGPEGAEGGAKPASTETRTEGTPGLSDEQRALLAEQFSDEEVTAFEKAMSPVFAQLSAAQRAAQKTATEAELARVRQGLRQQYPALSQDEVFKDAVLEANALMGIPGRYEGHDDPLTSAMLEALKLKGQAPSAPQPAAQRGMTAPGRPTPPASPLGRSDRRKEAQRLLSMGVPMDEVKSQLYG